MAPPEPDRAAGSGDVAANPDAALRLAIVILNWNRTATTLRCLDCLAGWRRIANRIWVVDNASEDGGLEEIERRAPAVRLLRAPANLGFGGGNNLALRRIDGDYALLLNNDARIDEASVEALIGLLDAEPSIAVAGPVVCRRDEPQQVLSAGGRDILRHVRTHLTAADLPPGLLETGRPFDVDYVPGSAALLRMSALRELGYLDEEYFFGGELADFGRRARDRGWRVVILPTARASHDLEVASGQRRRLYPYYILRNRFLHLRKTAGAARALYIPLWIALGLGLTARACLRRDGAGARALMLGLGHGLAGRGGCQNHLFPQSAPGDPDRA